jgi:N-acetylglucosamine malate deacetylase 1
MSKVIAVIAAHADDEVLGCGGTISKFIDEGHSVHILLMADGETSRSELDKSSYEFAKEKRNTSAKKANKILSSSSLTVLEFPDNRMDGLDLLDVVKPIEKFIDEYKPEIIITHFAGDVNIDHQITNKAVITACRPQPGHCVKKLLFMEVASSTEWMPPSEKLNFNPNYFVDISKYIDKKVEALEAYNDEMRDFPHSRSIKSVKSLAVWRGSTVGVSAAESFVAGRIINN